jgi:hypothetical protein
LFVAAKGQHGIKDVVTISNRCPSINAPLCRALV